MTKYNYKAGTSAETKAFIDEVLKMLNTSNSILKCDRGALTMLVDNYDFYIKATEAVRKEGPVIYDKKGRPCANPADRIANNYYEKVLSLLKEFGLTPRSRERIKSLSGNSETDSPLNDFLKNNSRNRG